MWNILAFLSVLIAVTIANGISPFGIVEGIKDCGSEGRLGTVEVTDCTATPCHFIPGRIYDVAIRYVSSVTSDKLGLRIFIKLPEGDYQLLDKPINGNVEAGIEYELTFQLPIGPELSGAGFDINIYILDFESFRIEVCAEAPVTIG